MAVGKRSSSSFSGTVSEYLTESSIHGLKFLVVHPRWWQRAYWVLCIVIATSFAAYFTTQVKIDAIL